MESIIAAAVILMLVSAAVVYLARASKRGQKCIGCPHSDTCHRCKKD